MDSTQAPKKVTGGAFGRFLAEKRAELTKECSGKPVTAVVKLASERFKALDEESRKKYDLKYKEAAAQYAKDLEAYLAAGGLKKTTKRKPKDDGDDGKPSKEIKRDPNAPKKDPNAPKKDPNAPKKVVGGAYGCYLAKHREALNKECEGQPGNAFTAVTKLAGQRWKELSAEDKKVFEDEYAAKMAKYTEEMKSYVPSVQPAEAEVEKTPERKKAAKASKTPLKAMVKRVPKASGQATSKTQVPQGPALESSVAAEAEKNGMTGSLLLLLKRQDVIDSAKTQGEVLKALVDSGGLLHPARRALLGA